MSDSPTPDFQPDSTPPQEAVTRVERPTPSKVTEARSERSLQASNSQNDDDGPGNGLSHLSWWMKLYPFHNLLKYAAGLHIPRANVTLQHRMDEYVKKHPRFAFCVRLGDLLFVGSIAVIVVAALGLGVWKTMFGSM